MFLREIVTIKFKLFFAEARSVASVVLFDLMRLDPQQAHVLVTGLGSSWGA